MFWYIINNTYFCVKYKDMKERIKQFFKFLGIGIFSFYMMLAININFDRNKRYKLKIREDLKNGWVTSTNKELPEDYSPKKYNVRLIQSDDRLLLQYKIIE
jgi:hypothetical protein